MDAASPAGVCGPGRRFAEEEMKGWSGAAAMVSSEGAVLSVINKAAVAYLSLIHI